MRRDGFNDEKSQGDAEALSGMELNTRKMNLRSSGGEETNYTPTKFDRNTPEARLMPRNILKFIEENGFKNIYSSGAYAKSKNCLTVNSNDINYS